ncbi:MAG: SDR family oxidoreductase [Burkholderiales bacterium]|nr:SDR family oxidoreductase [Burkholderiales bacterium]
MKKPKTLCGRVAMVTGAASGIGRALAHQLAEKGCHLALVDRDTAQLSETLASLVQYNVRLSAHALDVAERGALAELPRQVFTKHRRLDILINNAGVAVGGAFEEVSETDFDWLFEINFGAVVRLTRACLPLLKQSDDASLVNMSSLFGLIAPPGQVAYCASKFAVRGFSMALAHELADSAIDVMVAHPGGVATAIAQHARMPVGMSLERQEIQAARAQKFLRLSPDIAARAIVEAMIGRKRRVLVGTDARVLALLERLLPVRYWGLLDRFAV